LVPDRAVLKEQVHQHGLAAPDLAMDVKAARRLLVREQPLDQALLAHGLVALEPPLQRAQRLDSGRLRRVGLDRTGGDEGLIVGAEGDGWGGRHGASYGTSAR